MAVNNQNPFHQQYVDSFQGKNVDGPELQALDNNSFFDIIGQYQIADDGTLTSKWSNVWKANNPAPEDRSLHQSPDPNPINIPASQTVNIGEEVAAGNMVVGGGTSVDTGSGLTRIEIQPRYIDKDQGTTGKSVSNIAPEDPPSAVVTDYESEAYSSSSTAKTEDGTETGAAVGLNSDEKSKTEVSNPKDAAGINGKAAVFDADLSKVEISARPNELNVFSSYTYNLALYMLNSKSYVNLMTAPSSPQAVLNDSLLLMRSGGVGQEGRDTAIESTFADNFFMDDLELSSIAVGPSKFKQNTNVTEIRFNITEPRGVTLIEKLRDAAKSTLASTKEKYIHAPYLIEIKFKGYDETGQPINAPSIPKYIPIRITDITFDVTSDGTVYKIQAIPFANHAFGQIMSIIPTNIEITAATIGNIFNSGGRSFTIEPEEREEERDPTDDEVTEVVTPEKIKYSDSFKSLGEILTDHQRKRTQKTIVDKKIEKDGSFITEQKEIPAEAEGYDTYEFLLGTEIANARLNVDAIFDALDVPAPTGQKKDDGKANKSQFQAYAESFRGSVTLDKDRKTFKINAGTDITKLLNLVIMHSDYMDKNILEQAEKGVTDGKPIKWFKIKPIIKSAEGPGKGFDGKDGRYKYHVQYVVEPSVIYYHDFPWAPKSKPKGSGFHKVYDYIYSGRNTEVLDFKLQFRTAFLQVMTAGTGSPFADKNADDDFSPMVKTQSISAEGNTTNTKDSVTRARAKDLFSSVMSDGVDMIELNMSIMGDPAYIATSDAYWQDKVRQGKQYTTAFMPDGTINYDLCAPYVQVNLRTPTDYDDITGLANPNTATNSSFSGIYKLNQINSTFSGGMFQQNIMGLRATQQPTKDGVARSAKDSAGKERNEVKKDEAKATSSTPNNPDNEFAGVTTKGIDSQQANVKDYEDDFDAGGNYYADDNDGPYTSPTVNNARTAEIARGPDQTVATIPDVNADLSSSWNPPADVLKSAPPNAPRPNPIPTRTITPEALVDQTVDITG